ncbi:MAG TPA: hypothetical protein VFX44_01085 [Solirubrobacterales bacterium]|nr:hypothetical protein [Solirubrobacterales bacterium]
MGRSTTSSLRSHAGPWLWKEAIVLQINRVVQAQHAIHRERQVILEELDEAAGEGNFTSTPRPAPAGMFRPDGVAFYNQQEADCHFLLFAIRHILRIARARREDRRVASAHDAFLKAFPQSENLRNILEHLDAYEKGEGKLQEPGAGVDPDDRNVFIRSDVDDPEGEIYYHFGFGIDVPLKAAAKAAVELADLLEKVEEEDSGR